MSGGDMRARDADREEAIDFIEAAYSDGQLTRDEYDVRTGKALRAPSLADLDRLVRDLQKPGTSRVAARLTRLAEATGTPPPTQTQVAMANAVTASARRFLVGVGVIALTALVLFFLLPWALRDSGDSSPVRVGVQEQDTPEVDLLTTDGFRTFVDAIEETTGDTVVFDISIGTDFGYVTVPADATSDRSVEWTWRYGSFEDDPMTSSEVDPVRFDLSRIDADRIPGLLDELGARVEEPEDFYLSVEPDEYSPKAECYDLRVSNRFGENARMSVSCSGRVLAVDPPR